MNCALSPLPAATGAAATCPACGCEGEGADALQALPLAARRVRRREVLFHAGSPFHALYAVRSGTFKSGMPTRGGHEQVTAFRMPGEVLGLDAIASGQHATTAVALEDSEVVVLPYEKLRALAGSQATLHEAIARLLSGEIVREQRVMALRGSMKAGERLCAFLLNLSRRMKERGYSPREFHLRMSRAEIGSYLGLNLETVSRSFSDLQHQGVLQVDGRHVRIADLDALRRRFELPAH